MKNDSKSSLGRASHAAHASNVHAALFEFLQGDLTQLIIADARLKSHAVTQRRQTVAHDRRRSTERKHHAIRKQFALPRKLFGYAVKNELELELSGNSNVKA